MPSRTQRRNTRRLFASILFAGLLPLAASAAPDLRPVNRVEPEFPREAASVEGGKVRARMTVDVSGEVTRVEIVEATPRRVFDRAVVRALSQWKYPSGAERRTVDIDLVFKR